MSNALTFLGLAEKVLTEEKRPLSPSEIWKIAAAKNYDSLLRSTKGKTPANTLYAQMSTNIGRDDTEFVKYGDRPVRYYLKTLVKDPAELEDIATTEAKVPELFNYKESQLHAFLTRFVHNKFNALCKTIRHHLSPKKTYGEWIHPDIIGVFYPVWRHEVVNLNRVTGGTAVKLYSFELKKELSFTNLRESFFQAVSNSSWAHQGFLAAADISTDEEFREELRRLSSSFGIGVIELDIEDPDASAVLVPARERHGLDWDALNKVAINPDVQELLRRIKNDLTTEDVRKEYYDEILGPEELRQSIHK